MHKFKQEKNIDLGTGFRAFIQPNLNKRLEESYLSTIDKSDDNSELVQAVKKVLDKEHPSLAFTESVLASMSMNGNDDIFVPEYSWPKRFSIVGTHLDIEHKKRKIIGHNWGAFFTDEKGKTIDANLETYGGYYDINFQSVVYKSIFPKTFAKMVKLFAEKKAFMSMEGHLEEFDYGLYDSKGNLSIVERNDDTSFLTKNLRIYGGDGLYEGKPIGRVLKDFYFTGAGWVKVPANDNSLINKISASKKINNIVKDKKSITYVGRYFVEHE